MSKFKYTETEQQFNNALNHQSKELSLIKRPDMTSVEVCISESEELLKELGISTESMPEVVNPTFQRGMVVPTWEELCIQAEQEVGSTTDLESLFTDEELRMNQVALRALNIDYNNIHKLDKIDITICATAGILGVVVDILLIGIPKKTPEGLKGGPLSNYVRDWFNQRFPEVEMEKLSNSKVSKVSFDAQDNRHTTEYVTGLSAYYHRLLSLGHDPILGLIFGVYDILTDKMTTIDKTGKMVSQVMENYADRKESDIFAAIAKQIIHFKSDITTSMGLPAPLMALFNLLQFGSIGEEEQIIAEIVQGMYYEGYDFIHFCSMSIPTMIIEVIIRLGYGIKRIKEGNSIKDSIPFSLNREKHPKLSTMLFIGHSAATAVNAGKVYFTKNPMAINYPQWITFAKYLYKQLKWVLLEKQELKDAYVRGIIAEELNEIYAEIDNSFTEMSEEYIVVFN
ncbi:hypothetical protein M2475_000112 [Breznakia sp. PF5-3]|uniref:hypothetical protein n=1 Tax=unclassified Breznakia TaxID=2623764 RepID=UPI0024062736|nr:MULTISPECIES: hypothetical protein [unclassified Breznakia]MDF9823765.1 hypothetical protein [Breznakia sp. PM6-1]MDF9834563.1 hypothetical protein [Breznakia sp. PF5-3]MDF9838244.1 hypothetical protein [Breznakia sp. PFB2-8]MDF9860260.1 hypothetical protein [Breznakia sp. PH5-24]